MIRFPLLLHLVNQVELLLESPLHINLFGQIIRSTLTEVDNKLENERECYF